MITHTLPLLIATPETLHSDYRIGCGDDWRLPTQCDQNRAGQQHGMFIPAATGRVGERPSVARYRSCGYIVKIGEAALSGGRRWGWIFRWIASASLMLITGLVLFGGPRRRRRNAETAVSSTLSIATTTMISVADTPADSRRWKDPATLVFAYTPVEDPAVYQNVFRPFTESSRAVHRQARDLLSGAIQHRRDRSDALRPPAHRRLLDRPDRLRGQSRGRRPVRDQRQREGIARLSPDRHRQGFEPLSETVRPQGQARRAHLAVVELRQSCAARAVPAGRPQARRRLPPADVGRP